MAQVLYNLLGK